MHKALKRYRESKEKLTGELAVDAIRSKGRQDGYFNRGGGLDVTLSPVERTLTERCKEELNKLHAVASEEKRRQQDILGTESKNYSTTLSGLPDSTLADVNRYLDEIENDARTLYEGSTNARKDLDTFKSDNGISEEPRPDNYRWYIVLLLILVIADTGLNLLLMLGKQSQGIFASVGLSFAMAGINIILGFATGYWGLRHIRRLRGRFTLGKVGAYTMPLLIVAANLIFSYYRNPVSVDFLGVATFLEIIQKLLQQMFPDTNSIGLFVAGNFFSSLAAIDGYNIQTPFIGYHAKYTAWSELKEKYELLKSDAANFKSTSYEIALNEAKEIGENLKKSIAAIKAAAERMNNVKKAYDTACQGLSEQLRSMFREYRSEYLSTSSSTNSFCMPDEDVAKSFPDLDHDVNEYTKAITDLENQTIEYNAHYSLIVSELKEDEHDKADRIVDSFFKKIEGQK